MSFFLLNLAYAGKFVFFDVGNRTSNRSEMHEADTHKQVDFINQTSNKSHERSLTRKQHR